MDLLTINDRAGQYPPSYYAATAKGLRVRPRAEGRLRCDVCIVGGGYTGVSSALHLAQKGFRVILLDAQRLGWGASGRNGGQVNTGTRLDQPTLEGLYGRDMARNLWHVADEAVRLVKTLIGDHDIDCGFKPGVIHAAHRTKYLADERDHVRRMREDYSVTGLTYLDREALHALLPSTFYHGGTLDLDAGHLHPLNYLLGLADAAERHGAALYERSRVLEIREGAAPVVVTDAAEIECSHVLVGCNGYGGALVGDVARHVMPINGYIAATRPLTDRETAGVLRADHAVADSKFVINYFRLSQDRRLLFGGGETYGYRFPRDIDAVVRKPLAEVFPQLAQIPFDYCWGGTLGITMSRMPYVRRHAGNVLSASGFSGQGVALATLAGRILADAVAGQAQKFDLLAALPATAFPGGPRLRTPLLVLAMTWYALRDRLG